MNGGVYSAIQRSIEDATGAEARIDSRSSASGGCINHAEVIELVDGRRFFIKTNSQCPADMFQREAQGLAALVGTRAIRVPEVFGLGEQSGTLFLILEVIESGQKSKSFFETLGEQLANMHRTSCERHAEGYGWEDDNYLGSTVQKNSWCDKWLEFWKEHRLGFQFELARKNGHADSRFNSLADKLMDKLGGLLVCDEPPALIHGDLWNGNYMVGTDGEPVLIDPAVYFADREAEFGMTTLFGGFDGRFYDAYNAAWPLADGSEDRIAVYRLYHLLNHLNLFGASYRQDCVSIMQRFA